MKIFIDQGANHQLTQRLLPHWKKMGVEIVPLADAQVHLSFVSFSAQSDLPKILRLDGIYYDILSPYTLENATIRKSYHAANGIIYQSNYSKDFATSMFGKSAARGKVIYNGADPSWNSPRPHEGWNVVVCSNWRKWKRLREMIYLMEDLVQEYPDWTLHVVGTGKGIDMNIKRYPFVKWFGSIGYPQMQELYRKMDLAMHIAKRDWCPNVVIEFLAAGIPTIVSDCGGGATELVRLVEPEFVAQDDTDPDPYVPVKQYSDEWCAISPDFKTNVQVKLQQVYKDWLPKRVVLPEVLTSEYVAKAYIDFMREVKDAVH